MNELKGQLTLRAIVVGSIGCIVITATSVYTALKMGALPWPIIFAAIISLFFLKALGKTNYHEVNVTHTIMSAGSMVAGGLAFTIPGIWILGLGEVNFIQMLIVALAGVSLGLIASVRLRRHFIEDAELEFPIGAAAAKTIVAGDKGGKTGVKLFSSMGIAGIFTVLRDWLGSIPTILFGSVSVPGVAFGIYNSPMLLAIGFLVGTSSVVVWFLGALFGNFGIILGGSQLGFWGVESGQSIAASLGMGTMMGCGIGVVLKITLPKLMSLAKDYRKRAGSGSGSGFGSGAGSGSGSGSGKNASSSQEASPQSSKDFSQQKSASPSTHRALSAGFIACAVAALVLALCFLLRLDPLVCIIVVLFSWVTTAMAAQSVGQTGIDPMEIFGLIVLLIIAAVSKTPQIQLFFIAGIIAVSCGLAGDVMNDFKAGHLLGTNPKAQWIAQAIGGIIGAFIAVLAMIALVSAYGAESFGIGQSFVAAQASMVATMVGGIPSVPAFLVGLLGGCLLYLCGLPVMMLGLGIYLPFYMSFTAFLGALIKLSYDTICRRKMNKKPSSEQTPYKEAADEQGLVVASGVIGGESIAGVLIAFVTVIVGLSV